MKYRLVVLTHGDSAPLARTIASFTEHVTPRPMDAHILYDGTSLLSDVGHRIQMPTPVVEISTTGGPVGFCEATGRAWQQAVATTPNPDYVFWLEHDFVFTRPVDLKWLALSLDVDPRLAQMALMRGPANRIEKAAGGLYESRPGDYVQREDSPWLEHSAYFTTNPSLMTRTFMAENPWMSHIEQCEGHYGIDLVARGYRFGVWGSGEPWVDHIGVRNGFGY